LYISGCHCAKYPDLIYWSWDDDQLFLSCSCRLVEKQISLRYTPDQIITAPDKQSKYASKLHGQTKFNG